MDKKPRRLFLSKFGRISTDDGYVYYRDADGILRRFKKDSSDSRRIRIPMLDRLNQRWRKLGRDWQSNLIALGLAMISPWFVYFGSVYFDERDMTIKAKATISEDIADRSKYEEYVKEKRQREKEAKNKQD
eukprot:TRINITY_DN11911_c0_g1_i1.p1 TRINITY_DN11911_c0_g1~~TRINITY_DN11911_c0_g1_i1.p1  ORF type:complete len:131 (-),score=29.01 TRINITY_DN11911_c0_g1_i1:238-630(-)